MLENTVERIGITHGSSVMICTRGFLVAKNLRSLGNLKHLMNHYVMHTSKASKCHQNAEHLLLQQFSGGGGMSQPPCILLQTVSFSLSGNYFRKYLGMPLKYMAWLPLLHKCTSLMLMTEPHTSINTERNILTVFTAYFKIF